MRQPIALPVLPLVMRLVRSRFVFVVLAATFSKATSAEVAMSAVDREAIEAAFARADSNGDGKLSRDESQRFPEIAARFDELDTDQDGFLSLAEFAVGATPPKRP